MYPAPLNWVVAVLPDEARPTVLHRHRARLVVDLGDKEQWVSMSADVKGNAYEGCPDKGDTGLATIFNCMEA